MFTLKPTESMYMQSKYWECDHRWYSHDINGLCRCQLWIYVAHNHKASQSALYTLASKLRTEEFSNHAESCQLNTSDHARKVSSRRTTYVLLTATQADVPENNSQWQWINWVETAVTGRWKRNSANSPAVKWHLITAEVYVSVFEHVHHLRKQSPQKPVRLAQYWIDRTKQPVRSIPIVIARRQQMILSVAPWKCMSCVHTKTTSTTCSLWETARHNCR